MNRRRKEEKERKVQKIEKWYLHGLAPARVSEALNDPLSK